MDKFSNKITKISRSSSSPLSDLFEYRELLFFLAWREFKIRYKQTFLGVAWAVFQPFILMVVFTIIFNRAAGIKTGSENVPYALFSYTGLLFWVYFSSSLSLSSNSLVNNQSVVSKVYFPRILLPLSSIGVGIIDFLIGTIIFCIMFIIFRFQPQLLGILLFFPMFFLTIITVIGLGLIFSAVNVRYRDIKFSLPFIIQSFLFITPIIYPVNLIHGSWRWLLYLNPMSGVVTTLRSSLLGIDKINYNYLLISTISALVLLLVGYMYFKKRENEFADII